MRAPDVHAPSVRIGGSVLVMLVACGGAVAADVDVDPNAPSCRTFDSQNACSSRHDCIWVAAKPDPCHVTDDVRIDWLEQPICVPRDTRSNGPLACSSDASCPHRERCMSVVVGGTCAATHQPLCL